MQLLTRLRTVHHPLYYIVMKRSACSARLVCINSSTVVLVSHIQSFGNKTCFGVILI
jgi:hypothetical protein